MRATIMVYLCRDPLVGGTDSGFLIEQAELLGQPASKVESSGTPEDCACSDVLLPLGEERVDDVRCRWETDDPLANDTYNQNLLAWFGFEETAHQLACELGIEV